MNVLTADYAHWGAILKRIRKERDLSQDQIAYALNISQTVYSDYETSKKEPPESILEALLFLTNDDELATELIKDNTADINRACQTKQQASLHPFHKLSGEAFVLAVMQS